MKNAISFVIPTYNNALTIGAVIEECLHVAKALHGPFEIIVIDDGSTDQTGVIVDRLQKRIPEMRVFHHDQNAGYGRIIKELYYLARKEWIFSIPGDYQIHPQEIHALLPFVRQADMIIGWRVKRQDPEVRLVQSALYNRALRFLFGLPLHDSNSVHLMKTSILKTISLTSTSAFVDAELAIKATRAGFRIIEVPIAHQKDTKNGSGGSFGTIMPTVVDMGRLWLGIMK